MKINTNINTTSNKPISENKVMKENTQSVSPSQANMVKTSDSVTLTSLGIQLSKQSEQSKETPVDSARVEKLKAAISNGDYKIDAEKIAGNMMRFENLI